MHSLSLTCVYRAVQGMTTLSRNVGFVVTLFSVFGYIYGPITLSQVGRLFPVLKWSSFGSGSLPRKGGNTFCIPLPVKVN